MSMQFPDSNSTYNALQLNLERRFSRGFTALFNYTWSKSLDYNSITNSDQVERPADLNHVRLNHGPSTFDVKQNFVGSFVWELPVGRTGSRIADFLVRNWQTNGIVNLRTGLPFTVTTGVDRLFTGLNNQRPDVVSTDTSLSNSRPHGDLITRWFNTNAFALPVIGVIGTSGKGILRAPGVANVDFSLFKNFRIREGMHLQFRSEFFNILNHPNFGVPTSAMNSPSFGRILSANAPRILQFGLRLVF